MAKDKMGIRDKIYNIISWYEGIPDDYSDIDGLLNKRRLLSAYGAQLAQEHGKYKAQYRANYAKRKIAFNKEKNRLINTGVSGTAATAAAEESVSDLRLAESTSEGVAEAAKIIIDMVKEVLGSMNQHISWLKTLYDIDTRMSSGQP